MRPRRGQRIGPYRVIEDTGKRTTDGKPVWLAWSFAEKREREVTEHKLVKIGKRHGFG